MNRLQAITAVGLVGVSLLVVLFLAAFEGGHSVTPYGTKDSKGFVLGFNDRLTSELCEIMMRNTSITATIKAIGVIGVVSIVAEIFGLGILLSTLRQPASRLREAFFLSQLLFLPTALVGGLFGSHALYALFTGTADDETLSDGFPVWWLSHGFWICVSLTVYVLSRQARRRVCEDAGTCLRTLILALAGVLFMNALFMPGL